MSASLKSLKLSKLSWIGAGLALSSPVSGLVSFALVASLIGEEKLEIAGSMTTLGIFATWLPVLLGLCLFAIDLVFKPKVTSIWKPVIAVGLLIGIVGVTAVLAQNPANIKGANIGAGILIITGVIVTGIGIILKLAKK